MLRPKWTVALIALVIYLWAVPAIGWSLLWGDILSALSRSTVGHFVAVLAALALGGIAWWVKQRQRFHYGIAEVGIGALGAWFACSAPREVAGFTMIASVYVIVRGTEHIQQGWLAFGSSIVPHFPDEAAAAAARNRVADALVAELAREKQIRALLEGQPPEMKERVLTRLRELAASEFDHAVSARKAVNDAEGLER